MIFGKDIESTIVESASQCSKTCYIATAYCKSSAFEKLLLNATIKPKVKILFLRWELVDLVTGASDLNVYPLAKKNGWRIYINQKLHAKVYCFDDDCYIGSANLTSRGMTGKISNQNIESLSKDRFSNDVEGWFLQLISSSRELDDELYVKIAKEVDQYSDYKVYETDVNYSIETFNLLNSRRIEELYTTDFFWVETPQDVLSSFADDARNIEHDLMLLRLYAPISQNDISIAFHQSKAFHWLLNILLNKEEIYFGELSSFLHDVLKDDPAPYRKSVKILLNNLISWVETFSADVIEVDKPNVSTRLKLAKSLL